MSFRGTVSSILGAGIGLTILWNVAFNDTDEARDNLENVGKTTISSGAGLVDGVFTQLSEEAKNALDGVGLDPDHTTPSDVADVLSEKGGELTDDAKEFLGRLLKNSGVDIQTLTNGCDGENAFMNPDCFGKIPTEDGPSQ
tara:strand:- start:18313 stop:18735 length:423 start_codon:yes stop_codon:yes gene_type:complete